MLAIRWTGISSVGMGSETDLHASMWLIGLLYYAGPVERTVSLDV